MSVFKFSCPVCRQRIEVGAEFSGRRLDCPSCKATVQVPAAPESEETIPVAELVTAPPGVTVAASKPEPETKASVAKTPAPAPETPVFPPPPTSPAETKPAAPAVPEPVAQAERISEMRVAVLTPQIKLDIVREVRARIADPSHWLPGKKDAGEYNYAAKQDGDQVVSVAATDASATHFSLFGAVLLEFHRRNVVRVTAGRTKFLDEELTAAIQQVLGKEGDVAPLSEAERAALTHEQCLGVLDLLEKRFTGEVKTTRQDQAQRKIENVRLSDLVDKLEKNAPIRAEDVACALFYELEELQQRLAKLEQEVSPKK
jgi:hypothetical protein